MQSPSPAAPSEGYPPAAMTPPQSNVGALVSLVLGIVSVIVSWVPFVGLISVVMGIIGAVFGHRGFAQSRTTANGRGMAIAGLILNYLSIVIALAVTAFLVFIAVGIAQNCQTVQGQCGSH